MISPRPRVSLLRVFLSLALALGALATRADFTIEAYLTITTNPAVGHNLSVTGVGVTWTNNTGASSYFVQTTNSTANATTNLYLKLSTLGLTNVNAVGYTNATNLVLYGKLNSPLTVTIGGTNWASVGYRTNPSNPSFILTLPLNTANKTNQHTNIINEVRNLLSYDYPTNPVAAWAPLFSRYLGQNATNQSFTNKTFYGGTNVPARLEVSSGWLSGLTASNLVVYDLDSPGTGLFSIQFGAGAKANGFANVAIGAGNENYGDNNIGIGAGGVSSGTEVIALGNSFSVATNTSIVVSLGTDNVISGSYAMAYGGANTVSHSNAIVFGYGLSSRANDTALIGRTNQTVIIPYALRVEGTGAVSRLIATNAEIKAGTIVNATAELSSLIATSAVLVAGSGTNLNLDNPRTVRAAFNWVNTNNGAILHKSAAVTSLAGGNNILTRSTNNLVRFTSAGSAPNLNAITNGLGDGDWFWAVNQTAETLTIVNESGFTSIPENRIHLANGASNVTVGPYGMALFVHEPTTLNRWLCLYPDNDLPTTTSNALVTLAYTLATANTNHAVTINNSLSNRVDSLLAANTNAFTITTNDFALNTYYTNANQRAWVAAELDVPGVASASLFLDQNADGTWERTGLTRTNSGPLAAFLQPGARFLFTNQSGSPVIRANSSQWVKQ